MNIEREDLGNAQVQLTVTIDAQQLRKQKEAAAREASKEYRIPGFRPGKAPYHIVANMVGEGTLLERALDKIIPKAFEDAVKETETRVWDMGGVETDIESLDPVTVRFLIPTPPSVTLGDVESLEVAPDDIEVDEDQVEAALDELREQRAEWIDTLGPSEYGDRVRMNLRGDMLDGTVVVDLKDFEGVLVKPDDVDEAPASIIAIPGQEQPTGRPNLMAELRGLTINQQKEFSLSYPEDWQDPQVAGRTVLYKAELLDLKRKVLPEINDEWATTMGDFEDLEALKDHLHDNLSAQAESEANERFGQAVVDALAAVSEIVFPPVMLRREVEHRMQHLQEQVERANMTLDDYLASQGKSRAEYEDELMEEVEPYLRRSLVLGEYARSRTIELTPDELMRGVDDFAVSLNMSPEQVRPAILGSEELVSSIGSRLLTRKAIHALVAEMTGDAPQPLFPEVQEGTMPDVSQALAGLSAALEEIAGGELEAYDDEGFDEDDDDDYEDEDDDYEDEDDDYEDDEDDEGDVEDNDLIDPNDPSAIRDDEDRGIRRAE